MRLLTKTTIYFSLLLLPLMAGAGYLLYRQLDRQLEKETDEELTNDSFYWKSYFASPKADLAVLDIHTQPFDMEPATAAASATPELTDVMLYQEADREVVPFRQRQEVMQINGKPYLLTLRRSLIEKSDWFSNIMSAMLIVLVALLGCILLINWMLSRRMWKPFYLTLENMQKIEVDQLSHLQLPPSSTQEFNRLQTALKQMANRIHQDYQNMKALTEDAAHEMQTPLAIAQQQLELIMQDPALTDNQGKAILQTTEALQRLSRLTHGLLFLAKIENHQYVADAPIALDAVVEKYVHLFDIQLLEQQLHLQLDLSHHQPLLLHPILADTLVSNLLGNAIKYNKPGGNISITLNAEGCIFSNTSHLDALPVKGSFERFKKYHAYTNNSNGLGLAIVQKICEAQGWQLEYSYAENMHVFAVRF